MWVLDLELYDGSSDDPFTGSFISLSDYDRNKNQGYWSFSEGFAGFTSRTVAPSDTKYCVATC